MTFLLQLVLLTLVYALTLASVHPWDLAAGAALAAACLLAARRPGSGEPPPAAALGRRLARFPAMAALVGRDVLIGAWNVTLIVLRLRSLDVSGIVAVPFDGRSSTGVAVTAIAYSLPPGDIFLDVDWEREVMLVHVLDASDPDAVRERYRRFYARYQRPVFP